MNPIIAANVTSARTTIPKVSIISPSPEPRAPSPERPSPDSAYHVPVLLPITQMPPISAVF